MKGLIMRLLAAGFRLFRRFQATAPAGPYERILFGAFRSMLTVALLPPAPGVSDATR